MSFAGSGTDPDGNITGYSWSFPGGMPGSSTVASPGSVTYATPGTYAASFTVTDNDGASSSPATRTVTVAAFSVSASPSSSSVSPGAGTTYSAMVTPGPGFTGTVSFSVTGLPAGASATFNPATVTTSGQTTLTVTTSASTPGGSYPLTIRGTSGTATRSATVTLVIVGNFSIQITPTSRTIAPGGRYQLHGGRRKPGVLWDRYAVGCGAAQVCVAKIHAAIPRECRKLDADHYHQQERGTRNIHADGLRDRRRSDEVGYHDADCPMSVDRTISRRTLLRHLGAGAAMTAVPALVDGSGRTSDGAGTPAIGLRLPGELIRLDRNENAYGASPLANVATEAPLPACQYPQAQAEELQGHIAHVHGVAPEQVVLGCGSTEILRMAADVFLGSGRTLVVAQPTFEWISACARRVGASVVAVPLAADHAHDLDAMRAASDASTRLVYLCNPNNPTGTLTPRSHVNAFLRELPAGIHVIIDEAYHHYVGESPAYASFVDQRPGDPRVIVVRTFSKVYGLAGLRVGYAVCEPDAARLLRSTQLPQSVNVAGARAALAALKDTDHVRTCVRRNTDDRQEFFNQANARMLRVIDSQANFVMLNTVVLADQVVRHFKQHDLLVAGQIPGFDTHVRVSLGTPTEMERFWSVWDLKGIRHH